MDIIEITRSKLRRELLKYYFMHPGEKYYLRQLERELKLPVANIRRELIKLEKMGLFASQRIGNLVYYSLNNKHPLYSDIKSIVFKTIGIGNIFRRVIGKLKGTKYAFIYGSFAKGAEISASDIDFMVIGDVSQNELLGKLRKIEDQIGRTINPTTYSLREIKEKVKRKNHFILNVLKGKKIMILGEESELSRLIG